MKRDPKKDESADAAQIKEDESVDEYAQDDDIDENTGKFNCTAKKKKTMVDLVPFSDYFEK